MLNQYHLSTTVEKLNRVTRYRHDPDGNLLEDEKWHYEWNAENRLIAMEAKDVSQRLEFRYEPNGRRISKNVFKSRKQKKGWQKKSTIHYAYDGWNIIAELDAQGNPIRTHLWGFDISGSHQGAGGAGGLLASKNDRINTSAFVLYDGNGNVVQYVDADRGEVIVMFDYDPYGNVVGVDNVEKTIDSWPFGFSTKYVDGETGFSYYGYRYYNPEMGRWLNRDPAGELGGLNLYGFVANDTIDSLDPVGLERIKIWAAAFIKPSGITFPYGLDPFALWEGDDRDFGFINGSSRNWHLIVVDTDNNSVRINSSGSGMTKVTHRSREGFSSESSGKAPDPPQGKVTFHNNGNTIKITVENSKESGSNPLVPGAPTIEYSYTIVLDLCSREGEVFGHHTVYPWHEVVIESSQTEVIPVRDAPSGPTFVHDLFFGPQDLIHFTSVEAEFDF